MALKSISLLCFTTTSILLVLGHVSRIDGSVYSSLDEYEDAGAPKSKWPWIRSMAQRELMGPKYYATGGAEGPGSKSVWPWTESHQGQAEPKAQNGPGLDKHGRVQMGVSSELCDNGKTNLTLDWDMSPINYTCFHPETRFPEDPAREPVLACTTLPDSYMPKHFCMDHPITYDENIPTYGDHRPLWPVFGEYLFVPRQRWLHNIEHGAVVMLYHPCAYPTEVSRLRDLVRHCYGKHVITPSNLVSPERPLVLVAWGCRLEMAVFDEPLVTKFIQEKAMHGPEGKYTKEGQFVFGLLQEANKTASARYDSITCPTV